jgi:hypothetical protein
MSTDSSLLYFFRYDCGVFSFLYMEHWEGQEFKMFESVSYLDWEELFFHILYLCFLLFLIFPCMFILCRLWSAMFGKLSHMHLCHRRWMIWLQSWRVSRSKDCRENYWVLACRIVSSIDRPVVVARFFGICIFCTWICHIHVIAYL